MNQRLYYKYSDYLKDRYKEKVYKIPVNVNTTCPNRDGNIGYGGCIFCGEEGAGFELLDKENSIKNQISKNKKFISNKYKAEKFIIYFQNFTNTYINFKTFKTNVLESIDSDVVEIAVSTRPDCVTNEILTFLKEVKKKHNININIELGLQTCNYKSLKKLNRGHTLAEYIYTANRIKDVGFDLCTHIILNLPWDEVDDAVENAKIVSSIKTDTVKIHSLYILKDTVLGKMYEEKKISIINKDEYIERMILFLEYLDPKIGIQRLFSRAPKERTLFCNWDTSWWKLKDDLINKMNEKRSFQGKKYNYLIPKVKK